MTPADLDRERNHTPGPEVPSMPRRSSLAAEGLPARSSVAAARRIVVKLGTSILTGGDGGLARDRTAALIATAAALRLSGREVVLVSSGAVGLGRRALGLSPDQPARGLQQACAAIGQARLTGHFQRSLAPFDLRCGQLLVGQRDLESRSRTLLLRETLDTLLRYGSVPLLNENDALGAETEALLGDALDNDRLAALVASEIGADLLVLLTDVAGLYDRDPRHHADARLLRQVDDFSRLPDLTTRPGSRTARGGMASKVEAAWIACRGGCQAIIASGLEAGSFSHLTAGEAVGTWFPAHGGLSARQRWIALTAPSCGTLQLDAGAVAALRERGASLLAAGVKQVDGDFREGDVVELRDTAGILIGRAASRHGCERTRRIVSGRSSCRGALIRRAQMVLQTEPFR